jgi:hypothetical protein
METVPPDVTVPVAFFMVAFGPFIPLIYVEFKPFQLLFPWVLT